MGMSEVEGLVEAGESHGLVTRARALKYLSKRQLRSRLEAGRLVRVLPKVYRVVGAPTTWMQRVDALALWTKHAIPSHRTAAALHGLNGFSEGPIEITSTRKLRVPAEVTLYRVKTLTKGDLTEADDRKVTSVTRTLLDLAAATDRYTLRAAFDQALREQKTTLEKLATAIQRAGKRKGVIDARELLHEFEGAGGPPDSELERNALDLIESTGLPKPKVQWRIVVGTKKRRLDLSFADLGLVIEVDGYAWHSGVDSFEDDRLRNNSLAVRGYLVLHWTWNAMQDRPEELITELCTALCLRK